MFKEFLVKAVKVDGRSATSHGQLTRRDRQEQYFLQEKASAEGFQKYYSCFFFQLT